MSDGGGGVEHYKPTRVVAAAGAATGAAGAAAPPEIASAWTRGGMYTLTPPVSKMHKKNYNKKQTIRNSIVIDVTVDFSARYHVVSRNRATIPWLACTSIEYSIEKHLNV